MKLKKKNQLTLLKMKMKLLKHPKKNNKQTKYYIINQKKYLHYYKL